MGSSCQGADFPPREEVLGAVKSDSSDRAESLVEKGEEFTSLA